MSTPGCTLHEHGHLHGYTANKEAYLKRLRRIEGQVRGIARMVDEDVYCIDILTQVAAINKALHSLSVQLLEDHVRHCVVDAAAQSEATGDTAPLDDKISEAMAAITRLLKS
ncbi:MAG: metal-sensitive transcriptional regulator [Rothia sp. (in: high G+C Gram-positive bacteria)]|nr:metal-sensitive transcriptional regulator [Rothia sp. (in: high G+C Gram-positive bacteria)]